MTEAHTPEPDVVIEKRDGIGAITLNRPKAINALNHAMVKEIIPALQAWASDDEVRAVVVTGTGDRGLCAGGDIVPIYHDAQAGGIETADFWREEYVLNALIARYPKPYVVVMDGIVMGGGVGISAHGNVRIVTERSKIGMPEVGIGLVPDVGGTYLLPRSPGETGTHVALTASTMSSGDAIAMGFADHFIPVADVPAFLDALRTESVQAALERFATTPPEATLQAHRGWIDECYTGDDVEEIVRRLQTHGDETAAKAAEQILGKSPIAVKVALKSLRRAAALTTIEEVLNDEYRVSLSCLHSHDLIEGIRAQVIDKDRNPQWVPADLSGVTESDVDQYFADLGDRELGLRPPVAAGEKGRQ